MKCILRNDREVVWNKIEGELANEMQKLRENKCLDLLTVSGISVKKMKLFNFDSDEDADDIDFSSIKTADMIMCRYRCEFETESDMDPLESRTTRSELGILVERYRYTPAPTVPCECII